MVLNAFRKPFSGAALALICLSLSACGGADGVQPEKTHPVSGEVTLDGKPMPDGEIVLEQPGKAIATMTIQDGKFSGEAAVGTSDVKIYRYRKVKSPTATDDSETEVNYLPAQWNDNSKLTAEVKDGGTSNLKFAVTSK